MMHAKIFETTELLNSLPPAPRKDLAPAIRKALAKRADAVIVLDDDPTGTQTVYGVPVLTEWSRESIQKELEDGTPLFYVLTNSRSLTTEAAESLAFTIGQHIRAAAGATGKTCLVISRSDSTLRGHYPTEVDALEFGLDHHSGVHILVPAFFEGGRYTIGDVHYVRKQDQMIPVAQTPYARDMAFGYHHSDLKWWVEEKTAGAVNALEVHSFSIKELRTLSVPVLTHKINQCEPGSICIVNAAGYEDLQVFVLALLRSDINPVLRTAASFVAALACQPPRGLLNRQELVEPAAEGGLTVVGSYVPTSSRQLAHLRRKAKVITLEIDVRTLLNLPDPLVRLGEYANEVNKGLRSGKDVVIYSSRELIAAHTPAENLAIGQKVSAFLTEIVSRVTVRPRYVLAKGGVTSSVIATESLKVKRAMVLGQILPGVPVWRLGAESRFPRLSYIIFPGNVGDDDAVTAAIEKLGHPRSQNQERTNR